MSAGYQFRELVAVESSETRRHVLQFARKLFEDQLRIWSKNKAAGERNKSAPPTLQQCIDKSRQIRRKREVDSHYWNDLVSRSPIH